MTPSLPIAARALSGAVRVRPKVPFDEWAPANIRSGEGSFEFRPYQVAPAAAIFSPAVYSVSLVWYSGAGKTFLMSAAHAYALAALKLAVATQFSTAKDAEDWLRNKMGPFLRHTGALAEIGTARDVADEIRFNNGALLKVSGANSPGKTRTIEVHWTNSDEIDSYVQDASDEGDKLLVFEKRTRGRGIQIHTRSAYPSVAGDSRIESCYDDSDGCEWEFVCPRCGEWQRWHPVKNVVWADGKPEFAEAECPSCAGLVSDAERREASAQGRWVNRAGEVVEPGYSPGERFGGNAGYYLNAMAHVGAHNPSRASYLHEIAEMRLAVDKAPDPEKARREFVNTICAESYELDYEGKAEPSALLDAREDWDPDVEIPAGAARLFCGADPNNRFLAAQVWAIGERDVWPVAYVEISGMWDSPATWDAFAKFIKRSWRHESGARMTIRKTFLDSRFQPETVRNWARHRRASVQCVVGVSGPNGVGKPALGAKTSDTSKASRGSRDKLKIWNLGTDALKAQVYDMLDEGKPTELRAHFPESVGGEDVFHAGYFEGLLSEDREMKRTRDGRIVPHFVHRQGSPRNEPLDTAAYCLAAWLADGGRDGHARAAAKLAARAEALKADKPKARRDPIAAYRKTAKKKKWEL